MVMRCPKKKIKDEMCKLESELHAMMLMETADPLPVSHGDGTVRWQGTHLNTARGREFYRPEVVIEFLKSERVTHNTGATSM